MSNGELIEKLKGFPASDEVDWMLFSNLTPRRCDVQDNNVMIRRNNHQGRTCIMLNLERYWENEIIEEYEKLKKLRAKWDLERKQKGF